MTSKSKYGLLIGLGICFLGGRGDWLCWWFGVFFKLFCSYKRLILGQATEYRSMSTYTVRKIQFRENLAYKTKKD